MLTMLVPFSEEFVIAGFDCYLTVPSIYRAKRSNFGLPNILLAGSPVHMRVLQKFSRLYCKKFCNVDFYDRPTIGGCGCLVVFTAQAYARAVLGVVILSICPSVCPSVCHTRGL